MKVKRKTLFLIACLVWSLAGVNILRIGLGAYTPYKSFTNFLISFLVFFLFQKYIFGRLVRKHTNRIYSYQDDRIFFLKFFDRKSFFIMIFMMIFGIVLRVSQLASEWFIAVFYTGLGVSLLMAGFLFGSKYVKSFCC